MNESKSYQVAVIGSGAGGKEAAILAARNGLRVVLVEMGALGGTSFHRGYYSVRAFRACAEVARESAKGSKFGLKMEPPEAGILDWVSAQRRVSERLARELEDTLNKAGVDVRFGRGSFVNANTIQVESIYDGPELLHADYIVLATGSRPDFDGQSLGPRFVNIDQLLQTANLPKRLLIVGGGYIGCEIASIFRSLGCAVTLIEKHRLLPDWDQFISTFIARTLHSSGVNLHFGQELDLQHPGGTSEEPSFPVEGGLTVSADLVLVATGRKPNVEDLGLEHLKVETTPFIRVDECLRTSLPNVFAVGDVNGMGLMDSIAVAQARVAIGTILGKKSRFSRRWVPRCVHTDPLIASVGWTEEEARRAGLSAIAHSETFRLVTEDEKSVFEPVPVTLKVLVEAESRQILGVHAIGHHAAELVNTAALAVRSGTTIEDLSEITFVHPSATETMQVCFTNLGSRSN
jgi:pyruvate/2-oxoglutarate dehydrogenase complex dihydrolipoamide dehydrogenase (E3) component